MRTFTWIAAVISLCLTLASVPAVAQKADCVRDGKRYPHGTVLGGYICVDGSWKKL
ncbi:MAG: hypothetical protein JSW09_03555 [Pseudomonadota bacterium]|nr:MAG: hypothetical protein JSW09_03555 [Pseudomonadota bacterium]